MKIIILGAKGMLGSDLRIVCGKKGIEYVAYDLPELDLCADNTDLSQLPDCDAIVNCAAYTNVDGAESDFETAVKVNAYIPEQVAKLCANRDIPLIHISTDYVFDGNKNSPYTENDITNPVNAYGKSKLMGENAVKDALDKHIIVRTQSLFGINGKNFIKAIVSRLEKNEPLRVVDDQVSCPTFTRDLAEAIIKLLSIDEYGIVNVSSTGECSWYEFACAIVDELNAGVDITPVSSKEFPLPAKRPAYSVLDKSYYEKLTNTVMPDWHDALKRYLKLK